MKRSCMVLAGVVATVITGCAQRMTQESGGDVVLDSRENTSGAWTSNVRGVGGWERIRGSAFAQLVDPGTRISLTVERSFPGSNYGWNVREGTCAAPGRIVGDTAVYVPIFTDEDGRDARVVDVAERLEGSKSYVVSLYSRGMEQVNTIACGALRR